MNCGPLKEDGAHALTFRSATRWWGGRIVFALLVLVVLSQLYLAFFPKHRRGDLGLVLDAATRLRTGQVLYIDSEYLPHTKSPLATFAFVPASYLPVWWMDRLWDLALMLGYFVLFRWLAVRLRERGEGEIASVLIFSFFTAFNPLVTEIAFGQFNLLLLLATIAVASRSSIGAFCGGAAFAFSICFKPTQILFLPWAWKFARHRWLSLLGGATLMGLLAVGYLGLFGVDRIVEDHRVWWRKTSAATPYHLGRPDNYGLPSLFFWLGMPASAWGWFQIAGCITAAWLMRRKMDVLAALALTGCLAIVCSPMAWLHVYVLSFPFVVLLWTELRTAKVSGVGNPIAKASGVRKAVQWLVAAIVCYYWGTEFFNPTFEKMAIFNWMFFTRPPLIGLLAALLCWYAARVPVERATGST